VVGSLRALIVDDEPLAREELDRLLAETQRLEVVGKCGNVFEALQLPRRERPDALYLDVQCGGRGLRPARDDAGRGRPDVFLITAHQEEPSRERRQLASGRNHLTAM
jgi:two-component system, LytTR family, response regulator